MTPRSSNRPPDSESGSPEPGGSTRRGDTPAPTTPLAEEIKHGGRIYQMLVESVQDYAIFMLDPTGHISSWNKGAQRLKGYTPDEIIGRHFSIFYTEPDIVSEKPARELEIAARVGKYEEEGPRLKKDGTEFWANVVITAVRDENGALIGFAKVTRDLTERRASQMKAIEDAKRIAEAETANRTKAEFLAAMSHELRTPLNAIGGYTELLSLGLGGPITAEQFDYLGRIRRSQQHLTGIITDLLNFSRIEAGKLTYTVEPLSLAGVIETVLPMVEPQALAKEITLNRSECDPKWRALGDVAKVDQILLNLLSNAIKFTARGGQVSILCSLDDSNARIAVADTGTGIPATKIEAIFEPFVQLGRSLSSAHEGMGLGLAISRDLARAMRGDLTVASVVDKGSTFTLTLPRASGELVS